MQKFVFQTCLSYEYNEHAMIKCNGCHNACHYESLKKQDDELICNIWQLCLYPRNQQFIKTRLKKSHNEQDCTVVSN